MRWYRRSSRLRQSARGECTAPSGLLGLRAGFAADALRFLAALLHVAETVTEPGIADPDDGARIAYAVGLQGHRGWMVGGEHAHQPRRQHGARDRFQLAAPHFPFRGRDLERLQ